MKLRSLNIERFRAIEAMNLSFEDPFGEVRPLTVIAGPNGIGKTSVLYAVVQTLRPARQVRELTSGSLFLTGGR
jgi:recombinational DNA repair ATPase RecF